MLPVLTTARLSLQRIEPEDQAFVFSGLSHPQVIPYYGVRYETFEATKVQMDWYAQMEKEGSGLSWKMVLNASNIPCGVISIYFLRKEHAKAEIGFWLLPEFWNQGLAIEALNAVLQYACSGMHLHRLEGFVEEGNAASAKLLEKAGFVYEGTMRDCEKKEGRYISLLIYAKIFDATTDQ